MVDVVKDNADNTSYIQSWPLWRDDRDLSVIRKFVNILSHQYGERQAFLFIGNAPSITISETQLVCILSYREVAVKRYG